VVIGVGNLLMGDDGVGPRVAQGLEARDLPPGVEAIDGGLAGLSILDWLEGRQLAIIVDAAKMGKAPGTVRRFSPDSVTSGADGEGLGFHETPLMGVLELGRRVGALPPIAVYGIEPDSIAAGDRLSDSGRKAVDETIGMILSELGSHQGDRNNG